jgi:hypothetical protein
LVEAVGRRPPTIFLVFVLYLFYDGSQTWRGPIMLVTERRLRSGTRPAFAQDWAEESGDYPVATERFGAAQGLSAPEPPAAFEAIVVVPRFVKEMLAAQERCTVDKAPKLTIAQWLHAQPPAVQRRERLRALRRLGLATL